MQADQFKIGDSSDQLGALLQVTVTHIDVGSRTATLQVVRKPDRHPKAGPALVLEGVTSDGGGYVIIGGKIEKVPPWSPLHPIVEAIAEIHASELIGSGDTRDLIQKEAFQRIARLVNARLDRMQSFRTPAPSPQSGVSESIKSD